MHRTQLEIKLGPGRPSPLVRQVVEYSRNLLSDRQRRAGVSQGAWNGLRACRTRRAQQRQNDADCHRASDHLSSLITSTECRVLEELDDPIIRGSLLVPVISAVSTVGWPLLVYPGEQTSRNPSARLKRARNGHST